jgi:plasmid segregation protein ParM
VTYTIAGIDWGYSYVKAICYDEEIVFPSVIGAGFDISFQMSNRQNRINNMVVQTDRKYFLGELARNQSSIFYNSLRQDRYDDESTDALIKGTLGLLMPKDGEIRIVTGLPPKFYATHKQSLIQTLQKTHCFKFNGTDRTVDVSKVIVLPQLVGTALDLLYDDHGAKKNTPLWNMTFGIIDPGFGTTDLGVFVKGMYKDDMKDSIRYNMGEVCKLVSQELYNNYNIEVNDISKIDDIVRTGKVIVEGKSFDVRHVVDWAKKTIAMAVTNHVKSMWLRQWAIDKIFLTGGGGESLYPFIKEGINAEKPDDSQMANARGYYKKARREWG